MDLYSPLHLDVVAIKKGSFRSTVVSNLVLFVFGRNTWNSTNISKQMIMKKKEGEDWKFSDYNIIFRYKSNFGIRSCYVIKK